MAQALNGKRWRVYCCVLGPAAVVALFAVAALSAAQHGRKVVPTMRASNAPVEDIIQLPVEGDMPPLDGAVAWINSGPLKTGDLRGKVVLVEFWTYTCINWRRQYPYVRAWAEKYKNKGLIVIGAHSPEFAFEKKIDNVRRLTKEIGVPFPVAVDSDYAVWRAFSNEYWPALYFIDAMGRIRHHQFGEGEYEQSEKVIKQLLFEAGAVGIDSAAVSGTGEGPEAAADWEDLRSPETYLGYEMAENFASPNDLVKDKPRSYATPGQLALNEWALAGNWTIKGDRAAQPSDANGQLNFRFHARDLHLVMGPSVPGKSVRFRVLIDGHPPGSAHGTDIDEQGYGSLSEQRMYQLIRQRKPIGDRTFTITFLDPGAEVFCFTFG